MKRLFSGIFAGIFLLTHSLTLFAVDGPQQIHHFTIKANPTAIVGEAMDVTVEAKDRNDATITNYMGSIVFSSSDLRAVLPSQGMGVQFKETDQWVLKLSKWVVFNRAGEQTIEVTDAVEDAAGKISVQVSAKWETQATATESITIFSPENNSTIKESTTIVSGKTRRNSKVQLKLNSGDPIFINTDETGTFTKNLSDLTQNTNVLVAEVLDSNDAVIGRTETRFSVGSPEPQYFGASVQPGLTVESGTGIIMTIDAEPGLSEVSVMLDGSMTIAKEGESGKYQATTIAPTKTGSYSVAVNLKNNVGQTTSKSDALSLTVIGKPEPVVAPMPEPTPAPTPTPAPVLPPTFKNLKTVTTGQRVEFTFEVENMTGSIARFKIAYGENPDSLTEQVLTGPAESIKNTEGKYSWYVENLTPKTYTFRVFGVNNDGTLVPNFSSETATATIGVPGCTIGNVGEVSVNTTAEKSMLSWDKVENAISYNIYRVSPAGDQMLIQNTLDTNYTIFLSSGSIQYADFAIKALCDEKTESASAKLVSRVQTGPGFIGLLLALSLVVGYALTRRRAI